MQGLVCVNEILHYRIHPCKKRRLFKLEVEQTDQFLLGQFHFPEFHILKIQKCIFQRSKEALRLPDECLRLLLVVSFCAPGIRTSHQAFQLMVSVLAVRCRILQFPIGKQVKTHFPDVLLPQFRKNMGNIVGKDAVGRQDQYVGRLQVLTVMVKKVRDAVQGDARLAAPRCSLDCQDLILGVADNGILLLLYGTHDIFKPDIAVLSQFFL